MTTVREARPEEYEAAGKIAERAYHEAGMLPDGVDYGSVLRDAADRAENAELLVAVERDEVVGTVTVVRPGTRYAEVSVPGELEFRMLAVALEASGNGVGEALVRAVVDRARREDARRVVLCTPENATAAHRLYRRLGFRRIPERDWWPGPRVVLRAYALDV